MATAQARQELVGGRRLYVGKSKHLFEGVPAGVEGIDQGVVEVENHRLWKATAIGAISQG